MISIIPEREIIKAVTDKNLVGDAALTRTRAFGEANNLLAYSGRPVEIVIEGILYGKISGRLLPEHKLIFEEKYDIDGSAVTATGYNITAAIKFITKERKLPIHVKSRVIILTENPSSYPEYEQNQNGRVRIFTPEAFLKRISRFEDIKKNYSLIEDALITAFFIE